MDESKGSNVYELETTDDGQFYQAVRHAIVSIEKRNFLRMCLTVLGHPFCMSLMQFPPMFYFQMAMLVTVVLYMISYAIISRFKRPHISNASNEGFILLKHLIAHLLRV